MNQEEYEAYVAQEAIQQKQIDAQTMMYAPQIQEAVQQNQAVLVEQTNPKKIVKEIILRLRGLDEKPDGSLMRVAKSKMNQVGIENIWFILDSHINQGTIYSHLKDDEIRRIMKILQRDLVDNLTLNWKQYGIEREADLDVINNSILTNIFLALKRSEEQNEKNWIGKISVENISSASRIPIAKKESFLSKFKLG